jgi:hypothetical protein
MAYTTVDNPQLFHETKTYTGNNNTNNITGMSFQPDWVWLKVRSAGSGQDHTLYDVIRGATKFLEANTQNAEATGSNYLTAFNSDGFTLGNDQSHVNANSDTYVSWNWKAGGSASSNSDGTITSSVSANTTAGFSIVSYTGTGSNASVGHGLGVKPAWFIVKRRGAAEDWAVYHQSMTASHYINLNTTNAKDSNNRWNGEPTTSVLNFQSHAAVNGSSDTYISYCFAEKKGYSKFGSYTGNGNAEGPFIHLGFRPAWLIIRNTASGSENWAIYDNKRDPFNTVFNASFPNNANVDGTNATQNLDFLSNGFKCKSAEGRFNASGNEMIYMAFAESPFVNSKGIPNNGR